MDSGHGGADIGELVGRRELTRYPAGEHDDDTVTDVEKLVEVGRDDEHGTAARAGLAERAPDESGGADIKAAGGLGGDNEGGVRVDLAGEDQLLGVAARERTGRLGGGGIANVPLLQ